MTYIDSRCSYWFWNRYSAGWRGICAKLGNNIRPVLSLMAYVYDQANKQKLLVSAFQQHLYSVMVPVGAGMVPVPVGAGAGKMMPLAYFCQVNQ